MINRDSENTPDYHSLTTIRDRCLSGVPTGYRDLYWCHHLNEPVIIEYRDSVSFCINCSADLLGDSDGHTFIAHVKKP